MMIPLLLGGVERHGAGPWGGAKAVVSDGESWSGRAGKAQNLGRACTVAVVSAVILAAWDIGWSCTQGAGNYAWS